MNKYFVVATAKYPVILRGKHYKIGDTIPSELTDKEYEFYKHALNVESMKEVDSMESKKSDSIIIEEYSYNELKKELELARRKIIELESKSNQDKVTDVLKNSVPLTEEETKAEVAKLQNLVTDTSIKPKRPYAKKETK